MLTTGKALKVSITVSEDRGITERRLCEHLDFLFFAA